MNAAPTPTAPATAPANAPADARAALRTWLRLLACTSLIEREVRAGLRETFDTTLPRFDVLAQLDAASREGDGGLTMSALSRRMMVTNGNITGLVERLVQEGLVSRTSGPADRRTQVVRLTPAGARSLESMMPRHHAWIAALFAGLDADETTQLHALLGKLRSSIRDATSEDPDQ